MAAGPGPAGHHRRIPESVTCRGGGLIRGPQRPNHDVRECTEPPGGGGSICGGGGGAVLACGGARRQGRGAARGGARFALGPRARGGSHCLPWLLRGCVCPMCLTPAHAQSPSSWGALPVKEAPPRPLPGGGTWRAANVLTLTSVINRSMACSRRLLNFAGPCKGASWSPGLPPSASVQRTAALPCLALRVYSPFPEGRQQPHTLGVMPAARA